MDFMDDNFLLRNKPAVQLYHGYAKHIPVIDYHCHVSPEEIAEDLHYGNLTQVWLNGDHYKWRIVRANGIDENYVTGNASDYDKFLCYADAVSKSAGNPLYHWTHLELQRYFNCNLVLNKQNAPAIWDICNKVLQDGLSVRKMIRRYNVKVICTTDDPADDLRWHKKIREDKSFDVKVLPAFRPDKALNIDSSGFSDYINLLSEVSNTSIDSLEKLLLALESRIEFFSDMGCKLSDHALTHCFYRHDTKMAADAFKKRLSGETLSIVEIECYKTELLLFFAKSFSEHDWTMQLHYGAIRNVNSDMFERLGPDTGFDCIGAADNSNGLSRLLDGISRYCRIPRIIVYSINPNDNTIIDSIIGCFQTADSVNRLQHGSAWWFSDTKTGMESHLNSLASTGVLGNFIGMLTDSRSFLSYTRHEYFRRILCNYIGTLIENGEYPPEIEFAGKMVSDISYTNAERYFSF